MRKVHNDLHTKLDVDRMVDDGKYVYYYNSGDDYVNERKDGERNGDTLNDFLADEGIIETIADNESFIIINTAGVERGLLFRDGTTVTEILDELKGNELYKKYVK